MMSEGALLVFRDTTVGYKVTPIVSGARLAVHPGEVVGLVGPNGAGKSTLLRAVTGDSTVMAGSIELNGMALDELTTIERAAFVGVVPQQVIADFSFPSIDFVHMGRHPHLPRFSRPGQADRDAVHRAMEVTDTLHLAEKPVNALSGGDLQRLAFAQALATQPQVLLLDEPVSHLDLNHRMQVLDLTRTLAEQGMAVLAVFHELDLAARYSDRIAVVNDGLLGSAVPPEEAITAETLRTVFRVRAVVGTDPVTGSVSVTPVLRDGAVSLHARGRVHVVGGSGVAAPLMHRLVLEGWTVTAGALNAGDADAVLADALGVDYPGIEPFAPMNSAAAVRAAELAAEADVVVVCEVPFGHGNIDNLLIAVHANKPVVLIGEIEGRDFAGGAASSYWTEALGDGATRVSNMEGAVEALRAFGFQGS